MDAEITSTAVARVGAMLDGLGPESRRAFEETTGRMMLELSGMPARARVVAARELETNGTLVLCDLSLRVQLPGAAPYDVLHRGLYRVTHRAALAVGSELDVRVDPVSPSRLMIQFSLG